MPASDFDGHDGLVTLAEDDFDFLRAHFEELEPLDLGDHFLLEGNLLETAVAEIDGDADALVGEVAVIDAMGLRIGHMDADDVRRGAAARSHANQNET